jgi:inorganic triphosphatase YgiF
MQQLMQDLFMHLQCQPVFDLDFKRIQKDVFWGEDLQNLSDKLFKA